MNLDLQHYQNRHSLKSKVGRMIWNVLWLLLFRPTPRGNLFRPWRIALLKLFGAKVKWSSNVLPSCRIWQPWNLTMGAYACLSENVDCYTVAPIAIGEQATVSQGVKLCTASHDISSSIMELATAPITIGPNAWVAGWALLLPGVTIGEGAVVGAGSVVTHSVEPWTVVGGNPAKFIRNRELKKFQLRRAVVGVPSNIAEGNGRGPRKDYVHFLQIARGSVCEIITQLNIAFRQ